MGYGVQIYKATWLLDHTSKASLEMKEEEKEKARTKPYVVERLLLVWKRKFNDQ